MFFKHLKYERNNFYSIQLYRYFLKFILLYFDPEMVILKNKLVVVVVVLVN